ncbi:MAG TPA: TonB-dependent receptor [Candidatus Baltobacteraceae bacterium]|nr:TonB-dependent receptor [Candidatus Baltobacteraceae bacterium]
MQKSIAAVLLAAAFTLSAFSPPALGASGTAISGRILSVQGGLPVSNAKVELERGTAAAATSVTAADGSFTFSGEAPGVYNIRVSASGFQTAVSEDVIVLQNESQVSVQMALEPLAFGVRTIAAERVSTHASLQTSSTINDHVDASVLQAQDYMRSGDALATLPFVNSSTSSSLGDDLSLSIRGYNSTETATLLDGHPIGPIGAFGHGYDAQLSPFWGMSGFDVVYGSGATGLYGTPTIAGAIDFTTVSPTRETHTTYVQGFGNDGRSMTGLSATGSLGKIGYAAAYGVQGTSGELVGNPTQWGLMTDPSQCDPNSADAGLPSVKSTDIAACSYPVSGDYLMRNAVAKLTYDFGPATSLMLTAFNQAMSASSSGNGDTDFMTYQELSASNSSAPATNTQTIPSTGQTVTCNNAYVVLNDSPQGYECMSADQYNHQFSGPLGGGLGRYHDALNQDYHARITQRVGPTSLILDGYTDNYDYINVKGPFPSHHYQDIYRTHGFLASDELTQGKHDLSAGVFLEHQQHVGQDIGKSTVNPDLQLSMSNYFLRDTYQPNSRFTTFLDLGLQRFRETSTTSFDPRLSLMYRPTPNDVMRITGGRSSSIPDPSNMIGGFDWYDVHSWNAKPCGSSLQPIGGGKNPALKPESADDFEAAYGHRFSQQTTIQADVYTSYELNPLVFGTFALSTVPAADLPSLTAYLNKLSGICPGLSNAQLASTLGVNELFNAGSARYQGIDVSASVGLARNLTLNGTYAVQSAVYNGMSSDILSQNTSLVNGGQIYGVPLHRASLGLGYENASGFVARIDGYYVGAPNGLNRPAYAYANMNFAKTFVPEGLTINFGVNNVFDSAAQQYGLIGLGTVQPQNQFGDTNATGLSQGSEEFGLPFRQFWITFAHKV